MDNSRRMEELIRSENRFVLVPEAARLLSLSSAKIYTLIHTNAMPGFKFGGSLRIKVKDLMTYAEKMKNQKTTRRRENYGRRTTVEMG